MNQHRTGGPALERGLTENLLGTIFDDRTNFVIVPPKLARQGVHNAAFRADYLWAKIGNILSFGKLKVIEASGSVEASSQIESHLIRGNKKIGNIVIDSHGDGGTFSVGDDDFDKKNVSDDPGLKELGSFMDENSTCVLGACWAGQSPELIQNLSETFNGATVIGNQSVSSSFALWGRNSFTGWTHYFSYGKEDGGRTQLKIGLSSISSKGSFTRTINNLVKIRRSGEIVIKRKSFFRSKRRIRKRNRLLKKFE